MSINRRAAKRDKNEREIIDSLVSVGATVEQISKKGVADLLVGYDSKNYLMEVKGPKGKLTKDEEQWFSKWNGNVQIVRTPEEALLIIGVVSLPERRGNG